MSGAAVHAAAAAGVVGVSTTQTPAAAKKRIGAWRGCQKGVHLALHRPPCCLPLGRACAAAVTPLRQLPHAGAAAPAGQALHASPSAVAPGARPAAAAAAAAALGTAAAAGPLAAPAAAAAGPPAADGLGDCGTDGAGGDVREIHASTSAEGACKEAAAAAAAAPRPAPPPLPNVPRPPPRPPTPLPRTAAAPPRRGAATPAGGAPGEKVWPEGNRTPGACKGLLRLKGEVERRMPMEAEAAGSCSRRWAWGMMPAA
eukprot:910295-Pelagomonas_calceolata.AAC.6